MSRTIMLPEKSFTIDAGTCRIHVQMTALHKVILMTLLMLLAVPAQAQQSLEQMLRLKPGNSWTYRGTAEWVATGQKSGTASKQITWKSEITEASVHGPLKAYLVHGSVSDLPWYEPGREPGDHLWIVYQDRFYQLPMEPALLNRFHDPNDTLLDLIDAEEPVIQLPLRQSECTAPLHAKEKQERSDLFYCWHFEEKKPQTIHVKGVRSQTADEWQLWYRSNPDHQIWSLVPGIGFTAYDFSHHGTVSEVHVKLVEAHLK
jgi:hypothetical protein